MKSVLPKILSILLSAALAVTLSAQNPGGLGLRTLVIDPGHGGKDIGSQSKDRKTYEKNLALTISKKIKACINEECPDVKVLLTRDDDVFVPLIDRTRFATRNNADFFLSVHINSVASASPSGFSVWLLGPSEKTKDPYSLNIEVCKRENGVILLEDDYKITYQGFDPDSPESDIFLHLMQNAYLEQSLLFGQTVTDQFTGGPFKKNLGMRQDNFQVLRLASMPAALLELGFISNVSDLEVLNSEEQLDIIARNVAVAFKNYKLVYDESVGAGKPAAAAPTPQPTSSIYYGTQVLASKRKMEPDDSYFLGLECRVVETDGLYKYIIGVSEDRSVAEKEYEKIRVKYPFSFLVQVSSEGSKRL